MKTFWKVVGIILKIYLGLVVFSGFYILAFEEKNPIATTLFVLFCGICAFFEMKRKKSAQQSAPAEPRSASTEPRSASTLGPKAPAEPRSASPEAKPAPKSPRERQPASRPQPAAAPKERVCKYCGHVYAAEDTFCTECGSYETV